MQHRCEQVCGNIGIKQEQERRLTFDVLIPLTMHCNSLQEKRQDMVKEVSERENN